jgi:hypothetical protein
MKNKIMPKILPIRHAKVKPIATLVCILILAAGFLTGCGSKLSGIYNADAKRLSVYSKLDFTSGSKVELTAEMGGTFEGTYVVEGDKVKITFGGQTQVWTIDKNGCLDGGEMGGLCCKQ